MKQLWVALILAMLLTGVGAGKALAQSTENAAKNAERGEVPFCGELTEDECEKLDSIADNLAALTSGATSTEIKLYAKSSALSEQEISLSVTSAYTFVIQPEDLVRLGELQALSVDELAANPRALMNAMRLPYVIDRDQRITLAFSPDLLAFMTNRLGVNFPTALTFDVRVVDQVLYIRLADFAVLGGQESWMPEWIGVETRVILSNSVRSALAGEAVNIEEIQSMLKAPGTRLDSTIVYQVPPEQLNAYADFMTLSARGVGEHDGNTTVNYRLTWDIPRYLGGPLFAMHTGTHEFPSATSRLYGSTATILMDGFNAHMEHAIGLDTNLLYAAHTDVRWALGIPGGPPLAERPLIGLSVTTENRQLNAVEAIPAPDAAFVPPINFVLAIINLLQG